MRRIAVLTTGRQDYGILRSTLFALEGAADFNLLLIAGGMHLRERFGRTIDNILADGLPISRTVDFVGEPPASARDAGRAVDVIGVALAELEPDALILVGDRHETLAAGLAATLVRVPIVHLHGGEESEGAMDNQMRHALTKLAHLHLVSHETHARRVIQMGEDPRTVIVVGAPGVDNAFRADLPDRAELGAELGIALEDPIVLVTVHPTTLGIKGDDPEGEVAAAAAALSEITATYVISSPNSDEGGEAILSFWEQWTDKRSHARVFRNLGERRYWALLKLSAAVVGNSSSGIIDAPSIGIPSINVGDRQKGRLPLGAVTHVPAESAAIGTALRAALASGRSTPAVPATGSAAARILDALREWSLPDPPRKSFRDFNHSSGAGGFTGVVR